MFSQSLLGHSDGQLPIFSVKLIFFSIRERTSLIVLGLSGVDQDTLASKLDLVHLGLGLLISIVLGFCDPDEFGLRILVD